MKRHFFCIVLCLNLFGCATVRPVTESTAAKQVLRLRWVKALYPEIPNFMIPEMSEEYDRFNPIETSAAGFDTDQRVAFVGSSTGALYCLDIVDGKTIWRFDIDHAVGSTPIYDESRKTVFFGAEDGLFYAVHSRSGRKLWATNTGAEVRRKALLHNGTLYVINADNTVLALDPDSGTVIWQYRRPPMEGFSSKGHAGIYLYKSQLLTGFSDGYTASINTATGAVTWSHDLASEVSTILADGTVELIDADATPVASKGVAVVASVAGGLQGLNADTGAVLWTRPDVKGVTGLGESNGIVYVARTSFGIQAIYPETGRDVWSREFDTGVLQDPVIFDDLVLVSDSEYGLFIVSSIDGTLLQKVDQTEGFFARPSVGHGYMLIMGNNGTLYAMSIL